MDTLFEWSGRLAAVLAALTKILLGVIVLLVLADVAMRNIARPIAWSTSLTEYLLIYIAFLSAPHLVRIKGHVCADFMRQALPPAARRILEKLVYVLCVGLCLYLGWLALESMVEAIKTRAFDVRVFDAPKWVIFAPMAAGLLLSAVEFSRFLAGRDSIYEVDVRDMEGF